jgi:2-polyprenyl-6-methoxyphenol hydroxylase-like FAD-dependent oxidoreductase
MPFRAGRTMKVVIAGAGIGGLVAAMCLHRAGLRRRGVRSRERASAARCRHQHPGRRRAHPGGPRARAGLAATGIETRELRYANKHGQTIWADPRGRHAGLPWPQFSIHRGDCR